MYFLFVTLSGSDEAQDITVLMLPLHNVASFDAETKLYLTSVHDTYQEAQDELKRFARRLRGQLTDSDSSDIKIASDVDLHFVWLKYDPTEGATEIEDAKESIGFYIEQTFGGIAAMLKPGEEFAVVLATRHEDEADQLLKDSDQAFRLVYDVSDDPDEELETEINLPRAVGDC